MLGEAMETDEEKVELCLLTDADYAEEFDIIVDELIDQYIKGKLSADERLKFAQYFLSTPERQQKLGFALALNRHASNMAAGKSAKAQTPAAPAKLTWIGRFRAFWHRQGWRVRAAALAMIAIIVGALWLFVPRARSPQTFASLTLSITVSNTRAEGVQASKVKLPLNAGALRISLKLPADATSAARYRVELVNDNGETKPLEIAGRDAQSVSVVIPSSQLARGQYVLDLYTINADGTEHAVNGSYFFTVE